MEDFVDELIAHTPGDGRTDWHLLIDHLTTVATLARDFANGFGAGDLAYQLGLWHDVGKSNPAFQEYLRRCHSDPTFKGRGPDHKAAGAALAQQYLEPLALLVQGHHGGLKNRNDFVAWLAERQADTLADGQTSAIETAIARTRLILPAIEPAKKLAPPIFVRDKRTAEFFLRMLFSTLVDADYLDTEHHRNPHKSVARRTSTPITQLDEQIQRFQQQSSGKHLDAVNQARHTLYEACLAAAELPPGLFRLAIPTGGGKTRSAMAFALRHAVRHNLQRVIVAVPFITITEQTASVYRALFGDQVVLEHHSGADSRYVDAQDYDRSQFWRRLASENWDAPIIVTTTVQLFESLFANQTGRCRKLHRLARSVIILDEAQALPSHVLTAVLEGLRELCRNYDATVVLSTATQPAFDTIPEFRDLPATNIIPDAEHWFTALKRVQYHWLVETELSWSEVADRMRDETQALAIVNTKKDALALLDALNDPETLHLSTLLCGAHRHTVVAMVKQRLAEGRPCRLVSTQVIEAGVDLDFPLVLRALGPLDSIIQAAGRCNREGRLEKGRVIVFRPAEGSLPPGAYRAATGLTRSLIGSGSLDPDNPDHIRTYFRRLFATVDLDANQVQQVRDLWDYPETAKRFRMIDDDSEDVVVLYGDETAREYVAEAIRQLRQQTSTTRELLRRLQPYLVAVRQKAIQRYERDGLVEPLIPGLWIWHGKYDPIRGIVPEDDRMLLVF